MGEGGGFSAAEWLLARWGSADPWLHRILGGGEGCLQWGSEARDRAVGRQLAAGAEKMKCPGPSGRPWPRRGGLAPGAPPPAPPSPTEGPPRGCASGQVGAGRDGGRDYIYPHPSFITGVVGSDKKNNQKNRAKFEQRGPKKYGRTTALGARCSRNPLTGKKAGETTKRSHKGDFACMYFQCMQRGEI